MAAIRGKERLKRLTNHGIFRLHRQNPVPGLASRICLLDIRLMSYDRLYLYGGLGGGVERRAGV